MKKPILIAILLVFILAGVGPVGFGFWAESQMNRMMEKMLNSETLDFTIIKQERGWLSSTYDIAVELSGEAMDAYRGYQMQSSQQANPQGNTGDDTQPFNIIIRNVIHHGPFPYGGLVKGGFSFIPVIANIDTKVIGISGSKDKGESFELPIPYSILSLVSLTGTTISVVNIEPWSGIPEGREAQINWQGLYAEFEYGAVSDSFKGTINVPYFSISKPDENVLVSGILIDVDVRESIQAPGVGNMRLRLGEVKLNNLQNPGRNFSMKDFDFTVSSDVSDGSISSTMELNVESILAGEKHFGPGYYQLKLSNLDAESLGKIQQQVKELKRQGVPQEQMGIMMIANMFSVLPDLLARGPKFEITNMSLESDYGRMEGKGQVYFDTNNKAAMINPMLLKDAIIAELEFSIPEELLVLMVASKIENEAPETEPVHNKEKIESTAREQVKKQMDMLVEQNILVRSGKNYNISASFMNGRITVNGSEFNLPLIPIPGKEVDQQMGAQAGQQPLGQALQP